MRKIIITLIFILLICGCISQTTKDKAESACINSGGTWEYSDCNGHCTPETKVGRLLCEVQGCACTEVCIGGYRCICPEGMKWGSKEEGCIKRDKKLVESEVKTKCISLCKQAKKAGEDISNGPCLTDDLTDEEKEWFTYDWVCDVAHNPRQDIDNLPENQCREFIEGNANHFVEVDINCELIKVK